MRGAERRGRKKGWLQRLFLSALYSRFLLRWVYKAPILSLQSVSSSILVPIPSRPSSVTRFLPTTRYPPPPPLPNLPPLTSFILHLIVLFLLLILIPVIIVFLLRFLFLILSLFLSSSYFSFYSFLLLHLICSHSDHS